MRNVAGVSTGAIPNWKKGAVPERKRLERMASYFNTTVSYLLGDSEERHPSSAANGEAPTGEPAGAIGEHTIIAIGRNGKRVAFQYTEEEYTALLLTLERFKGKRVDL